MPNLLQSLRYAGIALSFGNIVTYINQAAMLADTLRARI